MEMTRIYKKQCKSAILQSSYNNSFALSSSANWAKN